jgi:hypothetical protein
MLDRFTSAAIAFLACPVCFAQGVVSVDLLTPAETTGTIPANIRIVDLFVDVATTDVWTGAGIRALTENGAVLSYFDADTNTPGTQPGLFNGGTANRFSTMLSKPRGRNVNARFTNAGAAATGSYDPAGPAPVTTASELNVAYGANPPETFDSPSVDGYIARIAVDITGVPEIPGFPMDDYTNWAAGPIDTMPAGSTVVLRSVPFQSGPTGTAIATFDAPLLTGLNWVLYIVVPEPTSLVILALGGLALLIPRRH